MQIVSAGDNLHEMSKSIFWGKRKKKRFVSAEVAQRVVNLGAPDFGNQNL